MANQPELRFPVDDHLLRLEPVFFHDSGVYVKTRREGGVASFVTTLGVKPALRPLPPPDPLKARFGRRNTAAIRGYFQAERVRARAGNHLDELQYFVEYLLPAFSARDCSASFPLDVIPWGPP